MAAAGVPWAPSAGVGRSRLRERSREGSTSLSSSQDGAHGLGVGGSQDLGLGAQLVHEGGGDLDTEVGGEQSVLDLLPVLLGQVTAGQDGQDRLAEAAGTGQAGAQTLHATGDGLGRLQRRGRRRARFSLCSTLPRRLLVLLVLLRGQEVLDGHGLVGADLVGDLAPPPARIEPQTSADDDDQDDAENDEDRFHRPIMPDSGPAAAGLFSPDHLSAARPHGNHRRDATPSRDNRKPAAHRLAYRRRRGPRPSISMRAKALSVHVRS